MAKKVIVAIAEDFTRKMYVEAFAAENFEVIELRDAISVFKAAKKERPDIILIDVVLPMIGGFELLKYLKEEESIKRTPVMLFAAKEKGEERKRAMELEAHDFVVKIYNTPQEVVLKAMTHLGEQKSYPIEIQKDSLAIKELARDLGYDSELICPKCNTVLTLNLIRDLSGGKNYFRVSFVCSKCGNYPERLIK